MYLKCAQHTIPKKNVCSFWDMFSEIFGTFVNNAPGWFFTYTKQVSIEKDKDYPLTAAMKQQVRELTLIIKPTGDAAGRITEIVAHLTGAARTLDFATDTYGAASNVVLPFTKITEGDDAGKWKATVRLLGVTGTEQLLMGEIRYAPPISSFCPAEA